MAFDIQTVIGALLAGFVLSLAMSQVFQLVNESLELETDVTRFVVVALMILAGPHILVSAAQRSGRSGEWPIEYVAACYVLSVLWAGTMGFCILAGLTVA